MQQLHASTNAFIHLHLSYRALHVGAHQQVEWRLRFRHPSLRDRDGTAGLRWGTHLSAAAPSRSRGAAPNLAVWGAQRAHATGRVVLGGEAAAQVGGATRNWLTCLTWDSTGPCGCHMQVFSWFLVSRTWSQSGAGPVGWCGFQSSTLCVHLYYSRPEACDTTLLCKWAAAAIASWHGGAYPGAVPENPVFLLMFIRLVGWLVGRGGRTAAAYAATVP